VNQSVTWIWSQFVRSGGLGLLVSSMASIAAAASGAAAEDVRVLNADAHFPEGPVWYRDRLYYVEYDRNTVMVWDGASNVAFWSQPGCGPSAVVNAANGEFLVTCYDNGTIGRISADGRTLPPYDHDRNGERFTGPNDFAPDAGGGIYFTTSGDPFPAINGKVFHIDANGVISQVASDVQGANGVAVSRDGKTLYVIETDGHRLLQFDIGAGGALSGRRVFLNLDDLTGNRVHLYPDGVKVDSRGQIYVGQNPHAPNAPLAGTIFVVDAAGKLLRTLQLPSPGVPNFAFSPDERVLYVTALDQLDVSPFRGKIYVIANH
jgi:sugar lactone lactonase YvrE